MKTKIIVLAVFFLLSGIVSCNSDDDDPTPNPNVTFKATINGASVTTPTGSSATGAATLTFNTITKIFTITVTHTLETPTNGHIHKAAIGENGGVAFPFASYTSPINYTSSALDASQEADLKAELYYVNIHSAAFPGGEIRGQLIKQAGDNLPDGYGY